MAVQESPGSPIADAQATECLRDQVPDHVPVFDIFDPINQSSLDERVKVDVSQTRNERLAGV